ncbi:MAG: FesM [Acidobacteria bacterium]|nr:FesM [Acidobacteriota bacterium]MBS1865165.1 FesM [Acidobacteriota bacterium]
MGVPNSNSRTFTGTGEESHFDLLRASLLGDFLRWRHSRTALQIPLLLASVVMILHGFFGPTLAPKNLATVLTWIHFRGALVLVLLCAGNFFCLACPFLLLRNAARKLFKPRFSWPRALRNKWISVGLFAGILFCYELFDLWSSPYWTAALALGYFAAVLIVDGLFKHAAFCKFVCPIGQFNFVASTLSPLEVKVRDSRVCEKCATKDCIKGRRAEAEKKSEFVILQRGCELALYLPRKVGNMDCTFCLDCVHACPHDNIGVVGRMPASELMADPLRSGVGYFSRRKDIAALVIVFAFGALVNAFGMVRPVYAVEAWLGRMISTTHEAPVLGIIFAAFLIFAPLVLLGSAARMSRALSGGRSSVGTVAVRYSYTLVPLGLGMWLAHYGFHFFTGILTVVPVTQAALASTGVPILGGPFWTWTGMPTRFVQPIELGFLLLGFMGSLMVAHQFAQEDCAENPLRSFAPWFVVCAIVGAASVWLMFQPMEMRAMLMGG